jgi:prepilin signal peptidase PulO-like enzyme (type II secretory pathway)
VHPSVVCEPVFRRYVLGDRESIAGTVYGTIVVLSVIAAGAKAYRHQLWQLDVLAATSAIVLWIAHVYSHGLGESLKEGRRLTAAELRAIAHREYSIILASVAPVAAIGLGAVGLVSGKFALQLAFAVGVVTLTAQGVRYARLEKLSRVGAIVTIALNLALGLTLVAVEAGIAH